MTEIWPSGNYPRPDGAADANRSGYINVGFQYHTFDFLPHAILKKDVRYLEASFLVAEYALARQLSDGGFQYGESNGTLKTGSVESPAAAASSATLFFYDLGHSLLVLRDDSWFTTSDECARYRVRLEAIRKRVGKSLDWLYGKRALLATDKAASNRTLAHALAFYFMGRALGHSDAQLAGRQIFQHALGNMTADGVFPEGGGFDSSYQAVNVLECAWMYHNLDPSDSELRKSIWTAMQRGVERENASILPTGEVATVGNSRISAKGERYFGHQKSINSKQILAALGYYAEMAGESAARDRVHRLVSFYFPAYASQV